MTYSVPILTPKLQNVVDEVRQQTQAPPELIISSLLGAISLAVQHRCRVQQKPGLEGPASLYLLTICNSGERKTAVQKLLFRPFFEAQSDDDEVRKSKMKKFKTDYAVWNEKRKALQKKMHAAISKGQDSTDIETELCNLYGAQPNVEKPTRLIYTDTTHEALLQGLHENGKSAALLHDEFGQFAQGYMSRQLPLLNTLWSGGDYTVDRKKTDSFVLKGANLTCFLQAQPGVWYKFLEEKGEEIRNNGFLSRALICFPISTQGTRHENANTQLDTSHLDWFYDRCRRNLEKRDVQVFRFSPEAERNYYVFKNFCEQQINPGGIYHAASDFASKAPENLARICAVMQAFLGDDQNVITAEIFDCGLALINYYSEQFLAQTTPLANCSQLEQDLRELSDWIVYQLRKLSAISISCSHIMQYGPNRIRKKDKLMNLLYILQSRNVIFISKINKTLWIGCNWNNITPPPTQPHRYL